MGGIFMLMIREAILTKLKEKNISQRKCAIECGIDCINFNHFLKGHRSFPFEDIEKVLIYLDLKFS